MIYANDNDAQQIRNKIKQIWGYLTEDEIAMHDTMRDVFFMAVRKKYGMARPRAEEILRHLDRQLNEGNLDSNSWMANA